MASQAVSGRITAQTLDPEAPNRKPQHLTLDSCQATRAHKNRHPLHHPLSLFIHILVIDRNYCCI